MIHSTCSWDGCVSKPKPIPLQANDKTIRSPLMPTVAELIKALPEYDETERQRAGSVPPALAEGSLRPVPLGRLRRLGLLGTLQTKIAAAYLFYWIRGWFKNAADNERLLAETHWRTAAR